MLNGGSHTRREVLQTSAATAGVVAMPLPSFLAPSQVTHTAVQAQVSTLNPTLLEVYGRITSIVDSIQLGCNRSLHTKAAEFQRTVITTSPMLDPEFISTDPQNQALLDEIHRKTASGIHTLRTTPTRAHRSTIQPIATSIQNQHTKNCQKNREAASRNDPESTSYQRCMELLKQLDIPHMGQDKKTP